MRQSLRSKKISNYSNVRFNSIDKLFNVLYTHSDFKINSNNTIITFSNNSEIYGQDNISIYNVGNSKLVHCNNNIYITVKHINTGDIIINSIKDDNSIFIGNEPGVIYNDELQFNSGKEVISFGNNLIYGRNADYQSINIGAVSESVAASNSISIGIAANYFNCNDNGYNSIYIGTGIYGDVSSNAINIGSSIGEYNISAIRDEDTIAIGSNMIRTTQEKNSIAIGTNCCPNFQYENSIAIGTNTGIEGQEKNSIYIGNNCGPEENYKEDNNSNSYIIGNDAGSWGFKKNCIQIGQAYLGRQKENTISINLKRTEDINPNIYFPEDIIYIGTNTLGDINTTGPNTLQFNINGGGFVPNSHTSSSPGFFVNMLIGSSNIGLPASSNNCVFYDVENYELFVSTDV